jgi:hypothetical protein
MDIPNGGFSGQTMLRDGPVALEKSESAFIVRFQAERSHRRPRT